ncbi:beta-propeller domain-containing protein [Natrinema salifodinae]|uniref:Secreted protein containing C-terminal beta-propeller domain n=1 Tax=Natrinema salifodinae TaxID=1202768 RepID=A0A1I0Q971_9EURY|nr:beta-propeller domain-containing protein [Natrinema salifodinae]SEW23567.1 Secreted protein containing C-terminal beta-propeller domain [Natrinema salifodinae]
MTARTERTRLLAVALAALLVGAAVGTGLTGLFDGHTADAVDREARPIEGVSDPELVTFESDAAFAEYLDGRPDDAWTGPATTALTGGDDAAVEEDLDDTETAADGSAAVESDAATAPSGGDGGSAPDSEPRHSETNVQEAALDEPAVLKTDGESVYYADYRYTSRWAETSVVDVSDPANPTAVGSIPLSGDLLLADDTLVVLGDDEAAGYDVSDPAEPEERWRTDLAADIDTARLHDGDLYLILVDRPGGDPCPMTPYGDDPVECTDVVRPATPADADAVYTAARVDPETGALESRESVVGSQSLSATYVSENGIYLSYMRSTSGYELRRSFLGTEAGAELLDARARERVAALDDLEISDRAKRVELREILRAWYDRMADDERREARQAFEEGVREHAAANHRNLTTTGIVRIDIEGDLAADASGEVPGTPLNQFSMDEHEDHLRIATTIPRTHGVDSENDVYVLDSDLETVGSVTGLGVDERIYSVRFEGDEGYVVTYREIDPFYTLDLSEPTDPTVDGELKLPGFSEYLHPLEDDLVLGVGQEDRHPKATLFDVTDPEDPIELDSEIFADERYSDVSRTHTAFLQDEAHGVFFMPGNEASYVVDYEGGELEEVAHVDVGGPGARAMYVGDSLYVFGEDEVVVLDERTWDETTRLDL